LKATSASNSSTLAEHRVQGRGHAYIYTHIYKGWEGAPSDPTTPFGHDMRSLRWLNKISDLEFGCAPAACAVGLRLNQFNLFTSKDAFIRRSGTIWILRGDRNHKDEDGLECPADGVSTVPRNRGFVFDYVRGPRNSWARVPRCNEVVLTFWTEKGTLLR